MFFLLIFSQLNLAQFRTDKFFAAPLDSTVKDLKLLFPSAEFKEKEVSGLREYYFNDMLDSVSFKVGFFFTAEGQMQAKALSNLGTDAKSGEKFRNLFKNLTIKQYGENFESKLVYGADVFIWHYGFNQLIMLTRKDRQAALTITVKKELPPQK